MEQSPSFKLNDRYRFTFVPKQPELFQNRRRFSIGAWSLHKYIGEENAVNLLTKIIFKKIKQLEGDKAGDKYSKKYRSLGELIIYAK